MNNDQKLKKIISIFLNNQKRWDAVAYWPDGQIGVRAYGANYTYKKIGFFEFMFNPIYDVWANLGFLIPNSIRENSDLNENEISKITWTHHKRICYNGDLDHIVEHILTELKIK